MKKNHIYAAGQYLFIVFLLLFASGCDNDAFLTNLEKGDKYYAKGDYQTAMKWYTEAAKEYQARLGKTYSSEEAAEEDAMKLVEAYLKAGLTAEKLKDPATARAMFEKATKDNYEITKGYYAREEVLVPAGYQTVWVPGYYEDVWVDGYYKTVKTDGYYETKQVWVDGYYRSDGTYVNGYYREVQVWHEGEEKQVWVDGHYEKKYIEGHYEQKWVPEHYEWRNVYRTRKVSIKIESPYIEQARAKVGTQTSSNAPAASENRDDNAMKAAYDRMTAAYEAWKKAGLPQTGKEFTEFQEAKKAYEALKQNSQK